MTAESESTHRQRGSAGSVLVVGTGLVGTSVGLALSRAGWLVHLEDRDVRARNLAEDLGAGHRTVPENDPDVVLVCTPPQVTGSVIAGLQRTYVNSIFSDVSSVKSYVQRDVQNFGGDVVRFVGGHPLAGRERSGPAAAQADLFDGRPWVLTPDPRSSSAALDAVRRMVVACGAVPVVLDAQVHDRAVALVSHLPQLVASAMAAQLASADDGVLSLAGQGVRDLTRIADSDPDLWAGIVANNSAPVLAALERLMGDLESIRDELLAAQSSGALADPLATADGPGTESVDRSVDKMSRLPRTHDLIVRGRAGRSRLPGKHGAARVDFSTVQVVVSDQPGELARLLVASGAAGVNVEDVAIEHSPGQPVGLVELSVRPEAVAPLAESLRSAGWSVHV